MSKCLCSLDSLSTFCLQETCQSDMRLTLLKKTNILGEDPSIPDFVNNGTGGSTVCSESGLTL